jgi:hypothetical protein
MPNVSGLGPNAILWSVAPILQRINAHALEARAGTQLTPFRLLLFHQTMRNGTPFGRKVKVPSQDSGAVRNMCGETQSGAATHTDAVTHRAFGELLGPVDRCDKYGPG